MKIHEKIKEIIAEKCSVPVETINEETSLNDLVQDSLTRIDFLFDIEEFVGKKIPEEFIFEIETVGDLINIINKIK
jgi:acyl carrier protein